MNRMLMMGLASVLLAASSGRPSIDIDTSPPEPKQPKQRKRLARLPDKRPAPRPKSDALKRALRFKGRK